ncbi:MAG TPA: hypothetical protein DD979_16205 [Gammaproteobacteria bacterium]|nr:hypothetical protein [Gammaproteobacteria bacterium]
MRAIHRLRRVKDCCLGRWLASAAEQAVRHDSVYTRVGMHEMRMPLYESVFLRDDRLRRLQARQGA